MGRMLIDMFSDIENSELLVVWGTNPATDSPPLDMQRLETAAKRGAEIIVIDPRRTETAKRTGAAWVPIRPGTDGALALSMINILIDDDLYDYDFAHSWCNGFDELRTYVHHFTPEVTETITGVPASTIRYLARRLSEANGACPVMYTGLEYSNSGIQAIRAVLTLFALAGQLDVPGGIGLAMPGTRFPINRSCNLANPDLNKAVARDRFPLYSHYRGESHASGLVKSVLDGDPYRIRALLIHGASLLTSWPQTPLWRSTLAKLEFVVTIDRQLTADAAYADIILPATTMFEIESYMAYGPIFRLRERIIEPVGESRNDYLIMAELAHRLGYGDRFPQTEDALIQFALNGSGYSVNDIREAGGWVKLPTPIMEYQKWKKGRLRPDGNPGFDTPSGKFEIASTILADYGYEPLPRYVEPTEGPLADPVLAQQFPLVFNSGARTHTDFRSQHHGIEGLVRDNPEPTVELNVEDAAVRGVSDGDLVEVRTPRGSVPFRARTSVDIVPGAIECNMGGGTPVGPPQWTGWNVNDLTDLANYDEISGFPVYKALLCDVVPIATTTGSGDRAAGSTGSTGTGPDTATDTATAMDTATATVGTAAKQVVPGPGNPGTARSSHPTRPGRLIYLDNNATTALDPAVRSTMMPFLEDMFGNPSSIYDIGRNASSAIETARRRVASLIGARPRSIIFTSGGSEADNLAIKGVALRCVADRQFRNERSHFITTAIEHPAVLSTARFLERSGWRVTYLPVDSDGLVDPATLENAVTEDTALVSIMAANNEVGTIEPISRLSAIARGRGALFHTDAVQAIGKVPVNIDDLSVDLLSLSGHKFHGPKGVGVLYVREGIELESLVHGGQQERGLRAGTENVAAIAGIGKAAELAAASLHEAAEIAVLRDQLETGIQSLVPGAVRNGHPTLRLPNTLNMTLPGLRGESVVIALGRRGIALSSGSACKSGNPEPTHVLLAMGRSSEEAHCAIRFSLSRQTTEDDVDNTLSALEQVLDELETTVRFLPCK
jgi:cysteine desulfurase NifS